MRLIQITNDKIIKVVSSFCFTIPWVDNAFRKQSILHIDSLDLAQESLTSVRLGGGRGGGGLYEVSFRVQLYSITQITSPNVPMPLNPSLPL